LSLSLVGKPQCLHLYQVQQPTEETLKEKQKEITKPNTTVIYANMMLQLRNNC